MLSVMCAGRKDTSQETVGIRPTRGVGKERRARKARKDKGKARNPRKPTTKRKEPATIATRLAILRETAGRRKSQTMQVPAVEVICTA